MPSRIFAAVHESGPGTQETVSPARWRVRLPNVILPVAGADYVGPLPAELQDYVDFAVGVLAVSKQPDAAQALVKFMSSPEAAPLIRKSGMEPPPR